MDISPSIIGDIEDALCQLDKEGKLDHGSGLHAYSDFDILL